MSFTAGQCLLLQIPDCRRKTTEMQDIWTRDGSLSARGNHGCPNKNHHYSWNFLSSWGQMSRPFVKMMMPTSHGRDRPRCGRFVTWSSLPLVGGVSVPSRKEEKVWKSAHHCWVSPRPKSQRRRKFVETRGCFHPGGQRVCPSFYWTVNVPSRGFGTHESAFISHLWPRQVCTSKC